MSQLVSEKSPAQPPVMTFPPAESAWLCELYARADVILEYGSGGSTVFAGGLAGKTVYSVESDPDWAADLADWFNQNPPRADLRLHPVDIGKTGKWGAPQSNAGWRRYHRYPLSVWDLPGFRHPDLVLVDGRFRAACLLATLFRIERPVTLLFDDYVGRPVYATAVERYAEPTEIRGRMARFDLEPTAFPVADMSHIWEVFTRQN
jgi:hypothetical protein